MDHYTTARDSRGCSVNPTKIIGDMTSWEESTMIGRLRDRNLCLTCNKDSSCMRYRKAREPIIDCEEYDGREASTTTIEQEAVRDRKQPKQIVARKYKGLCVNCDHREICIHAMQEGGIWHCEEYQ